MDATRIADRSPIGHDSLVRLARRALITRAQLVVGARSKRTPLRRSKLHPLSMGRLRLDPLADESAAASCDVEPVGL